MLRRILAVALLALALPAGAAARLADAPTASQLSHALRSRSLAPAQTAAIAVDLRTGATIFSRLAAKPLRPASNEKLGVALTALDRLGAGFRISTVVLGQGTQDGSTWNGDLVLKGFGDPSLNRADLARLARAIHARGIHAVSGRVLGDESYFDTRRVGAGWKRSYYKLECPPLSALVVDRAWLDGHTRDAPARAAANLFTRALRAAGVRVAHKPGTGTAPAGAVELARVKSPRLQGLIAHMDTESDNFYAEMLLKVLGARERHDGSSAAGAAVVRSELASRGIPLAGVVIADGSGLSQLDRLTVRALAALLVSARSDAGVSAALRGSLAVAGETGTLEDRMRTGPAHGIVRGKTGTTNRSSALSGYVDDTYAFAILINGAPVAASAARAAEDRYVQLLAAA